MPERVRGEILWKFIEIVEELLGAKILRRIYEGIFERISVGFHGKVPAWVIGNRSC